VNRQRRTRLNFPTVGACSETQTWCSDVMPGEALDTVSCESAANELETLDSGCFPGGLLWREFCTPPTAI